MNVTYWPTIADAEIAEALRAIPGVELALVRNPDDLDACAVAIEVLVIGGHFFDAEVAAILMRKAKRLHFIQSITAGYDGIRANGVPSGVKVATPGDAWSPAVAEHGLALLLAIVKCLPYAFANQQRGHWERGQAARMEGLAGRTLVIVGYGSIGREFARRARAFGMRFVALSRSARRDEHVDEALRRGFKAVKTNPLMFDGPRPRMLNPGFNSAGLDFAHNCDAKALDAIDALLAAFREGLGSQPGLHLDVNFSFRPEGLIRVARIAAPHRVSWVEMDVHDPDALAHVRRSSPVPIASLEALYGRRQYRPYFDRQAVDVAIVNVPWNGYLESLRIASLAEAHEVNVAPHNFYGHLATCMSAHFCAAIPNFRIMEIEVDNVPWKDELVSTPPHIENGELIVPQSAGWGADVNEEALAAHPPRQAS